MKITIDQQVADKNLNPMAHRFWEWLGLFLALVLAAGLRLWGIEQNGFGNPYYAATVRSMLLNWHNFFFASYDPAGWVSVDKPPVSLWLQTLSAKLLGFNGFSLIFPQVIEGCLSVALVYGLVRRQFDEWAAFVAALVMAVGPICVAVDRYNNTDECMMFVILLAAWTMSLAVEKASRGWLVLTVALVGVGFNVKMMVAFIVLPAFYLLYWIGAAVPWRRRLADLMIASVVLSVVSLSWPLAVDLTPASQRPFVGSSQDNSMLSLSLGWNGFERLLSRHRGFLRTTPAGETKTTASSAWPDHPNHPQFNETQNISTGDSLNGDQNHLGHRGFWGMNTGQPGPWRLMNRNMAGQIMWFLPLMLLGIWAVFKKASMRYPFQVIHSRIFLWFGWFVMYGLVFSFMGGMMHAYYIVMLAPPVAALSGIGIRTLWKTYEGDPKDWAWLPLALLLTAIWQIYIWWGYSSWKNIVDPIVILGVGLSVAGLIVLRPLVREGWFSKGWIAGSLVTGLFILFISPMVWSLTAVLVPDQRVEANPDLLLGNEEQHLGGFDHPQLDVQKLVAYLKTHQEHTKYLVFGQSSQSISPIIIQTGEPAVSIGGFMGRDPTITLDQFVQLVKEGQVRYMLVGGRGGWGVHNPRMARDQANVRPNFAGGGFGGFQSGPQKEIAQWVRKHGQLVKPSLWRLEQPRARVLDENTQWGGWHRDANMELYELKS